MLHPPTSSAILLQQALAIYATGIFPALQTPFCVYYHLFTFLLLTSVAGQHVLVIILLVASLISSI